MILFAVYSYNYYNIFLIQTIDPTCTCPWDYVYNSVTKKCHCRQYCYCPSSQVWDPCHCKCVQDCRNSGGGLGISNCPFLEICNYLTGLCECLFNCHFHICPGPPSKERPPIIFPRYHKKK